jgi:hypothetical protein
MGLLVFGNRVPSILIPARVTDSDKDPGDSCGIRDSRRVVHVNSGRRIVRARPGKGRPGTAFSNDIVPLVLEISFCLFFAGGFWCTFSRPPRESLAMRMAVYVAFVVMVLAQLVLLQML